MAIALVIVTTANGIDGDDEHCSIDLDVSVNRSDTPAGRFSTRIQALEIGPSRHMNDQIITHVRQAVMDHEGPSLADKDVILVVGIS